MRSSGACRYLEENMRSQTSKVRRILSLIFTSILLFTLSVPALARDYTDGSELRVATPEQLEIQLGPDWAGVEFQLRTDSGVYPGTIPVGEDGVLCLEIGGSSSYQLTCIGSAVPAPTLEPTPEVQPSPAPTDTPSATSSLILESEFSSQPQATITVSEVEPVDPEFTFQDIPVWQLGLFGGGLVVAIGVLIVLAVLKKRRGDDPDEDDDY